MTPTAEILADSISEDHRLTTFKITCHRFVLAEFNTHRTLSRNSASSRAIPLSKQLAKVVSDPAMPLRWPAEKKGMQGGDDLNATVQEDAEVQWIDAAGKAALAANALGRLGVHKSIANRLLEPFLPHTIVATATAWQNFFDQRCSPLAQPEIKAVADLMRQAYDTSTPKHLVEREWHLPFIDNEDWEALRRYLGDSALGQSMYPEMCRISAARCARTSYETQDGKRDIEEDLDLYDRLSSARPAHWSPLEHVATPWYTNVQKYSADFYDPTLDKISHVPTHHLPRVGNLVGWRSLRTTEEFRQGEATYR